MQEAITQAMDEDRQADLRRLRNRIVQTELQLAAMKLRYKQLDAEAHPPAAPEPCQFCADDLTPEEVRGLNVDFGEAQPAPDATVMTADLETGCWSGERWDGQS